MNSENDKKIQDILKQEFDSVLLSTSEKEEMLKNIHRTVKPQVSPFYPNSNFLHFYKSKMFVSISTATILLFVSGYGMVAASDKSMPGDILYPIKTAIVEEIKYTLTPKEERVAYAEKLIDNRLNEARKITKSEKKVDDKILSQIEDLLVDHAEKLDITVEDIPDTKEKIRIMSENIIDLEEYEKISNEERAQEDNKEGILNEDKAADNEDKMVSKMALTTSNTENVEIEYEKESIRENDEVEEREENKDRNEEEADLEVKIEEFKADILEYIDDYREENNNEIEEIIEDSEDLELPEDLINKIQEIEKSYNKLNN